MAHIWLKCEMDGPRWRPHRLESEELTLAPPLLTFAGGSSPLTPPARIKRCKDPNGTDAWLLIAPPRSARINGILSQVGLRILQDRDEVHLRGASAFYFSTEQLAQTQALPAGEHAIFCPRCREVVEPGSQGVCCPGCQTWYHQRPERSCWTYADTCALCRQPTALSGAYRWQPEPEESA